MCASIVEDDLDKVESDTPATSEPAEHPYEKHPRLAELLEAVEHWVQEESLGKDGLEALETLRTKARQMAQDIVIGAGKVRGV